MYSAHNGGRKCGGEQEIWKDGDAKWDQMRNRIVSMDWNIAFEQDVEQNVQLFTDLLLGLVTEFVPTTRISQKCANHPWLSKASWKAILQKRNAEGTEDFTRMQKECSSPVHEDYCNYTKNMKKKVDTLSSSPKQWWK